MTKIRNILNEHRVLIGIGACVLLYQFAVVNGGAPFYVTELSYMFYTVDFSLGFCSRFLPGAVYHAVAGVYTKTAVSIYLTGLYLIFVFLLAFLLEKFIKAFPEHRKTCFIFTCLFLTGPFTIQMFVKQFGMLDFYWAFLFLISCLLLKNRYLRYLLPVTVACMVTVHYGALVCYVAALLLLVLFRVVLAEKRQDRVAYLTVFGLSLLSAVGFTLYFLLNDKTNVVYPVEQFDDIVRVQRGAHPEYYEFYLYNYIADSNMGMFEGVFSPVTDVSGQSSSMLRGLIETVLAQIKTTVSYQMNAKFIFLNVMGLFSFVFLGYLLFSYFKSKKNLLKRIMAGLFFLLSIIITLTGVLFSTDNVRWLGHSVILLFVFVFYLLYFDYREGIQKIQGVFSKVGDLPLAIILFFYMSITADPYTFML